MCPSARPRSLVGLCHSVAGSAPPGRCGWGTPAGRAGPTGSRLGQPAAPPPVLRLARQRGIPLALAQQAGVGYAPGIWPHAARDWKGGRVVFPHTTPEGRLVNLYGRAVGPAEQVPKAKRHDHLPGDKGYFNALSLQMGAGPLWVCEGACDALALRATGVPRVVAIFGVQGWCWAWAREARELVFALDADTAGQQQWRALAREAALRGKRVAGLPPAAYGGCKDVNEAWTAGVLAVGGGSVAGDRVEGVAVPENLQELWVEHAARKKARGCVGCGG